MEVQTARDDVSIKLTVDGRPALTATAKDDDHVTLPPFDGEVEVGPWWLPSTGDDPDEDWRGAPVSAGCHVAAPDRRSG